MSFTAPYLAMAFGTLCATAAICGSLPEFDEESYSVIQFVNEYSVLVASNGRQFLCIPSTVLKDQDYVSVMGCKPFVFRTEERELVEQKAAADRLAAEVEDAKRTDEEKAIRAELGAVADFDDSKVKDTLLKIAAKSHCEVVIGSSSISNSKLVDNLVVAAGFNLAKVGDAGKEKLRRQLVRVVGQMYRSNSLELSDDHSKIKVKDCN